MQKRYLRPGVPFSRFFVLSIASVPALLKKSF